MCSPTTGCMYRKPDLHPEILFGGIGREFMQDKSEAGNGARPDRYGWAIHDNASPLTGAGIDIRSEDLPQQNGALSISQGGIQVEWSELNRTLVLKWAEYGGPPLAGAPATSGFGTLLSNHTVRGQLAGALTHTWNSDGLVVDLSIPLERLRD
jgi:hypothetical protein